MRYVITAISQCDLIHLAENQCRLDLVLSVATALSVNRHVGARLAILVSA